MCIRFSTRSNNDVVGAGQSKMVSQHQDVRLILSRQRAGHILNFGVLQRARVALNRSIIFYNIELVLYDLSSIVR